MELRHLLAFVTVAELRHFGRAAQRLGLTQPPLSRQIRQLEGELGQPLFVRHARAVELTEAGASYLAAVRPHLEGLQSAHRAAQAAARRHQGRVRVGFVSSLAYGLIPSLLGSLRANVPPIEAELFEGPSAEQCRAVRERRLDLGLVFLPVDDPDLKMRPLFREPLVAMVPASHAFAAGRTVTLGQLRGEPFILCARQPDSGFRETVLGLCRANGFEPRAAHGASSTAAMAELVAGNLGVALVPNSAADRAHAGVAYRPLAGTPLELSVAAVWRPDAMTPVLRVFLDHVIEAAAQLQSLPRRASSSGRTSAMRPRCSG